MAEFSLDVAGIKEEVETTFKQEEEKLQNSELKTQADANAIVDSSDSGKQAEMRQFLHSLLTSSGFVVMRNSSMSFIMVQRYHNGSLL